MNYRGQVPAPHAPVEALDSTENQIERDLILYGVAYEVNGERVDPMTVVIHGGIEEP